MKNINFKDPIFYMRLGLGLVFLAIGLGAFFSGEEVSGLIDGSFVPHIIPLSTATLTTIVAIHDTLMCLLIVFMHKYQKYLFAWAMIWLVLVMIIIGEPIDAVEHLGYFALAFGLFMVARKEGKVSVQA